MKHTIKLGAILLATCLVAVETASAQQYGGGGGAGGFGGGGGAGGFGGGATGGTSSGGFGGLGSSTTGGAFGQRSVGGMATGAGAGSFTGTQQQSMVTGQLTNLDQLMSSGTTTGVLGFQSSAFVGGGGMGTNGSNFVGGLANRGINGAQNGAVQGGANGQRGAGQFGGGQMGGAGGQYGGQNNRNNNRQQNANAQGVRSRTEIPIATSYTIGFSTPSVAPTAISAKIADQLNRSHSIASAGGVNVQIVGKTAVLQGTVASDHDRDMAAQVAMLEPGVAQVKNELQVTGSAPRGATLTGSNRSESSSSASHSSAVSSSASESSAASASAPALAAPKN